MKVETKVKYLEKARNLIVDKDNWCQGHSAVDKDGNDVDPRSRKAIRFCVLGAVYKAIRSNMDEDTLETLLDKEAFKSGYIGGIVALNDDKSTGHAHRKVIGAFNRAIKKLRKQLNWACLK